MESERTLSEGYNRRCRPSSFRVLDDLGCSTFVYAVTRDKPEVRQGFGNSRDTRVSGTEIDTRMYEHITVSVLDCSPDYRAADLAAVESLRSEGCGLETLRCFDQSVMCGLAIVVFYSQKQTSKALRHELSGGHE